MRREHAFAREAAQAGVPVVFVESPADVRRLRSEPASWSAGLRGRPSTEVAAGITVRPRSTVAPGHRGPAAARLDCLLLGRLLGTVADPDATVVGMLPWQWPAVAGSRARRRVFDCADNWAALIPQRAPEITRQFARIAAEADEIVVTSDLLEPLFPGRAVTVVRNGAPADPAPGAPSPLPRARRMAYVGTLSERFDADLLGRALDHLPGWTVDLFGPCAYAGRAGAPDPELADLLAREGSAVRWHGPLDRAGIPAALDAADVLILPNRRSRARGQSSMKMYDYAARGRPVVTTDLEADAPDQNPPDVRVGSTPATFAAAVSAATGQDPAAARAQVAWSQANTWAQRWPAWSAAVLGADHGDSPTATGGPATGGTATGGTATGGTATGGEATGGTAAREPAAAGGGRRR